MILKSKFNITVIKLSLILYYSLIVNAKDYEYCINSVSFLCPGLENVGISKYKISKVRSKDYYLDPEAKIERESYPDYLALSMIQAKGLCSYGGDTVYITDISEIRYGRSYQCYYAYQELQCDKEEKEKTSSKVHKRDLPTICKKQCYEYYNSLVTFLNNNDYCPFQFQEEFVQPDDVYQARLQYTDKMREICDNAEDSDDCFLLDNEKNNCGFISKELAANYCVENSARDECCYQFFRAHREIYVRNDPTIPLIFGVSVFLTFAIIGLFFSFQFIKDIKREERNRALRSVEKMFINSNSTTTSINSMDSGSQQSFPISLATSDSNMTALNAMNGSCPNIPMIINDANNSNPALNSPVMNLYRMNRHNKNKSSSLVNFNIYAQPILKSQSMGRNFRRKNHASNSNGNKDKHNKKKKVMTSSEAQQLYPRTTSNTNENNSVSSSNGLPYSAPNGSHSSVNLSANNRHSDSHNPMLDKKANNRKTSLPQLPYTSGLSSPVHTKTPQDQDIDSISYDITNVKPPSKINSVSSYNTSYSNNTNEDTSRENNTSAENTCSELSEKKNEGNHSKFTKRSASLHAASVKDLRFDSVKIQQLQQHILKQQQQLLQKQRQQKLIQQQQQLYYMPQPFTSQTPFSPQQVFNPHALPPQPIPQHMALPPMANSQTVTPLPQQFSPQSFISTQTVIPTQQMAPALPIRNKSMQSRSSSVKIIQHKNSLPQMTRKYSLSALETNSSTVAKESNDKMELRQRSLDYYDNETSSYTTLGSKINNYNRFSDSSNITNISEVASSSRMIKSISSEVSNIDENDETSSYYTEISSDVRTEDSMTTMIPTVVESVPPSTVDTMAPTLMETMINSPQILETKTEVESQLTETPTSILKNGNQNHHLDFKVKDNNKNGAATHQINKPVKGIMKRSFVVTNVDIESDEDEVATIMKEEKEGEEKVNEIETLEIKSEPKKVTPSPERRKKIEKLKKQSPSRLDEYVFEAVKSFYPNEYSKDLKVLPGMTFKIMENINPNDFWVYVENIETGEKGNIPINCLAIKES